MTMPYFVFIAWRYLRSRLRQTVLTVLGVALGVMVVTLIQSYMGGLLDFFIRQTLASTPHVTVTQTGKGLPNPAGPLRRALENVGNTVIGVSQLPVPAEEEALKNVRNVTSAIERIPGVTAVSPFVSGQGIIVNGNIRQAVNFIGVQPLREAQVTDLRGRLRLGTVEDLANRANGIILGNQLAKDTSVTIGDRVTLISRQGASLRFQVVAVYYSGLQQVDTTRAYINLAQAQQLSGSREITGIGVNTTSRETAVPVARHIANDTGLTARTWREVNSGILDLFTTISMIFYLVTGLTMVVAGFGIANTLVLTVSEKRRDIGVLKAMGTPAPQIAYLFLTLGAIVGVLGVVIGELGGATGIEILRRTAIPIQVGTGVVAEIQNFPMLRTPRIYVLSAVFGLLVSVLAGVLPSLRAAHADPLEVIRGAE